jgi:uncharacterized membrane protein YjjB (DUF3815 family)
MNLLLEALGSIARWLLAGLMGYFVAHGVFSQAAADNYTHALAGALAAGAVSLGWSLWQKYSAKLKILTALSMPAGSSVEQLQQKVDSGMGAKVGVVLLACALGAGAVTSTSCAGNAPPTITPGALSLVKAAEVVKALDAARDIAQVVQQAYPAVVTPADWQKVLTTHQALVTIIGASPNGWKPTAQAGLDQLQKDLSPTAAARLGPYLAFARALVDAFVPAGA